MDTLETLPLVEQVAVTLSRRGWRLATAESCTGGLVAAACTEIAGSSVWFERGVVTYSNEAKTALLGVPASLIETNGAVSESVARAMAEGMLRQAGADVALAVTGIAGPGGGSDAKPVGTVWFAWATAERTVSARVVWPGDRAAVRAASVEFALKGVLTVVSGGQPGAATPRQ